MPRKKQYIEDEVLEKAMHLFWKNGYEATSMRALEKGMGINQFSIYANFKNKNHLLVEVLKHYQNKVYTGLLAELEHSDGGLNEIKRFFYRFVDFVKVDNKANGCLLTNTRLELHHKSKKVEVVITTFLKRVALIFEKVVRQAQNNGEIKQTSDIRVYVHYLLGMLQGVASSAKFFSKKETEDYIETAFKNLN